MKKNQLKKRAERALRRPSLRFSPYAWGKLLFLRDRGETEIGGFGLASADDPLWIHDILTVRQQTTVTTVTFDDAAVADLFDLGFTVYKDNERGRQIIAWKEIE